MKLTTTKLDFDLIVQKQLQDIDNLFFQRLVELCDERIAIQRAKVSPEGYNDQTGQLRSSVGYIIYRDGKIRHENFELAPYGTDKAPGLKAGRELALSQLRITEGWGVVLVAGMEYASWLESNHNRTVLASATFKLEDDMEYILKNISV
ncbi:MULTISPECIES: hypothetical protein [Sphingobacterium]|uniref:hypothetical protein n=1 Tax=Sphingobacterium TaxID=28453 RepID=UPI00257D77CA|nr:MULTISPECIES: hypothetical protein [Sphingobacterium]